MYQEEVYGELTENPYFAGYAMEQCQQDLETLTSWGNLATIQDTKRVSSMEEFKNKKFRFQLTETTVEIERMVIRLENLSIEGASLEPSLLEGLLIAQKLKERYGERLRLWQYRREFYEKYRSDVEISDRSLKKLDRIYREELQEIKQALGRQKKAAYQEAMIEEYLADGQETVK